METIKNFISENGAVYIFSQAISIIATFFLLFSYQQRTHKRIVCMQAIAGLLFGTHYLMLRAYEGMMCNYIGMVRGITYSFRTKSKLVDSPVCPCIFAILFGISGFFTYTSLFSLLPTVAMMISSFVLWNIKAQQLRALTLPTSVMWLIYNASCGSVAAVGTEVLGIISIFIGLFRFRKKKVNKEN
jgi:hypothetical protein